jgi:hypothetical protein
MPGGLDAGSASRIDFYNYLGKYKIFSEQNTTPPSKEVALKASQAVCKFANTTVVFHGAMHASQELPIRDAYTAHTKDLLEVTSRRAENQLDLTVEMMLLEVDISLDAISRLLNQSPMKLNQVDTLLKTVLGGFSRPGLPSGEVAVWP